MSAAAIDPARLAALFEAAAREDAIGQRLGRFCSGQLMLATSHASLHMDIVDGRLTRLLEGPLQMRAWQFGLRAEDDAWLEFWKPEPAPGYQDIFAMSRFGHLAIDGDVGPLLAHLRFYKRLLALPRGATEQVLQA